MKNHPRSLTMALGAWMLTASTGALAQASTYPTYTSDPFQHREDAKIMASRNTVGTAHLDRIMSMRTELGLDSRHTFQVVNAGLDEMGGSHARLQQYFAGVKVENGIILSHQDAAGAYSQTDRAKRNITLGVTPALSQQRVLDIVAGRPSHLAPYSWAPRVELRIQPLTQRINVRSGAPVTPSPLDHTAQDTIPDDVNATETTVTVTGYRLAYLIRTIEGVEGTGGSTHAMEYLVDANSGEVLRERSAAARGSFWGQGKGKFTGGTVLFNTVDESGGFQMYDSHRNYSTWDDDRSSGSSVNTDADNVWGDGMAFAGDGSAGTANRQTAMVDGHFGSRVYWELMNNVFSRQGPDDDYYDVNVYAHYGTNWDDAEYWYASGNIHLGDGASRQALDCLGHENGHAFNDFTAELGGSGEQGGLNESDSDIWGAMTTFYLGGGAYANQSSTIPATGGQWSSVCSGRNMKKPSARGQSDWWYTNIGDLDEHDVAAPNNRAFYFLSQGASPVMTASDYSPYLPWGMSGIGTHKAARIWYAAMAYWMPDDADYSQARNACLMAAMGLFGPISPEYKAVQNAFAGINVGGRASGYPTLPPSMSESEPNDSWQGADFIARPNVARPAGAPDKISVMGTGTTDDWFFVSVMPGQKLTFRLNPLYPADYDLVVYDSFLTQVGSSAKVKGYFDTVTVTAASGLDPNQPQQFYVKVHPYSTPNNVGIYFLDVDFF